MDNKTNSKIIEGLGKEMETKQGNKSVRALYHLSKGIHSYSYAAINNQNHPIEVTLNCSGSKNMIFSSKSATIKKVLQYP